MSNVDEFILYGHHHDRADHYEIPLSQMTMGLFLFTYIVSFLYHRKDLFRTLYIYIYEYHCRCLSCQKQELLTLCEHLSSPVMGSVLFTFFVLTFI